MHTRLYVGNLPFSATALELQQLFSQYGNVAAVDLVVDKFTGRPRGFAFVTMNTPEDAKAAIDQVHGHSLDGRNLTVNEARPPGAPSAREQDRRRETPARPGSASDQDRRFPRRKGR